jgi:hypothetical protein
VTAVCAICARKNTAYKSDQRGGKQQRILLWQCLGSGPMATKSSAEYVKLANVVGLYRHVRSGRYHAAKKIQGKRREVSLRTTDRPIAERRLRDWINTLQRTDREKERGTPAFPSAAFTNFILDGCGVQALIRKLISMWQGHRDGGKLIIDTYTEVFGGDDMAVRTAATRKAGTRGTMPAFSQC